MPNNLQPANWLLILLPPLLIDWCKMQEQWTGFLGRQEEVPHKTLTILRCKTDFKWNFPESSSLNADYDLHWKSDAYMCCDNGLSMCKLMRCLWQRCALTCLQKLGRWQGVTQLLWLIHGTKTNKFRSKWARYGSERYIWLDNTAMLYCHKTDHSWQ